MNTHFELGRVVATPAALMALEQSGLTPQALIARHASKDWRGMDGEDQQANEAAVFHGSRILSAYTYPQNSDFWVITEADRSVTTILLPSEY